MKLTKQQRSIAAAILGVSNAGSDHLFLGSSRFKPEHIRRIMEMDMDVDSVTHHFVRSLCESEQILEMFQVESRSWYKEIQNETIDSLSKTHNKYAQLFNAMKGEKSR